MLQLSDDEENDDVRALNVMGELKDKEHFHKMQVDQFEYCSIAVILRWRQIACFFHLISSGLCNVW